MENQAAEDNVVLGFRYLHLIQICSLAFNAIIRRSHTPYSVRHFLRPAVQNDPCRIARKRGHSGAPAQLDILIEELGLIVDILWSFDHLVNVIQVIGNVWNS